MATLSLLHHKNQILLDFLNFATSEGYEPHFETNGTIEVDFAKFEIYKKCRFAVSVKLENSGESEARRINATALKAIKQNAAGSFYKLGLGRDMRYIISGFVFTFYLGTG